MVAYPLVGYWLDIGKHDDFEKAQQDIKQIKFTKPLIVIPAKGGSKGVLEKHKSIRR